MAKVKLTPDNLDVIRQWNERLADYGWQEAQTNAEVAAIKSRINELTDARRVLEQDLSEKRAVLNEEIKAATAEHGEKFHPNIVLRHVQRLVYDAEGMFIRIKGFLDWRKHTVDTLLNTLALGDWRGADDEVVKITRASAPDRPIEIPLALVRDAIETYLANDDPIAQSMAQRQTLDVRKFEAHWRKGALPWATDVQTTESVEVALQGIESLVADRVSNDEADDETPSTEV